MDSITSLLKQSSCYGNNDASFMYAVILSNGVGTKAKEMEVRKLQELQ